MIAILFLILLINPVNAINCYYEVNGTMIKWDNGNLSLSTNINDGNYYYFNYGNGFYIDENPFDYLENYVHSSKGSLKDKQFYYNIINNWRKTYTYEMVTIRSRINSDISG